MPDLLQQMSAKAFNKSEANGESANGVWEDIVRKMDTYMRSSFHINTIWHHVLWSKDGSVGKDQHGTWWFNIRSPRDEDGRRPLKVDYYNEAARHFLSITKTAA